jgi:hypothetical protein
MILLSGCADTTTSPEAWAGMRNDLRRSAKLRQQYVNVCIAADQFPDRREELALIMNVRADSNVQRTLCTRMMDAVASGRLTYADYKEQKRNPSLTVKSIKVMQGK